MDLNDNREIGSKFDKNKADEIFDALDKAGSKENNLSKNIKKEMNNAKEVADLIEKAKSCDSSQSVKLFKQALTIDPCNIEIYEKLSEVYRNQNDTDNEKEILKSAIKNIENPNKKAGFVKRLKEIN